MYQAFETKESAREALATVITGQLRLNAEDVDELAEKLLPIWQEEGPNVVNVPGTVGLQIPRLCWVIRDDDLKLFEVILDGIKASAASGFFLLAGVPLTATMSSAAALLTTLFKLGSQVRRKGVWLQPRQYSILAMIAQFEAGLSDRELITLLTKQDNSWTDKEIADHLKLLEQTPASDGTKVALVNRFPDGRWRTSGI